ncbi:hypothetical protein Rsub_03043 [Raphidocelis subcapitata]|uniref:FAS1 domain-containing protein n=1 Tax=Raphidocelis subcapitata TaxID=307507 RepID=A0A2V0NVN9_9CHLO|nr:hypothetical protein Rsub_03043 [Raphidocelis subcapitata]|eukprot:GBF90742.1 hypothetical protein Rsub_03043 [Raphidocelis subcapitata]
MRSATLAAALAALLLAQSVYAQTAPAAAASKGETVLQALKRMGATRYIEILDASKATEAPNTTVLAASNEAIDDYLNENRMTMDDVKKREALADRIIGYTVILDGDKDIISEIKKGEVKYLPTYNIGWAIEAKRDGDGKLTFTDAGGDDVTVDDGQAKARKAGLVFVVDELLLPGNIFERFNDFRFDVLLPNHTRHEQELFETFKTLVRRAGVTRERVHDMTIFVPIDDAFKAVGITPASVEALSPEKAFEIISYHAIHGYEPIPTIKAGQPIPTVLQIDGKNQTIKLDYAINKTDKGAVGSAFVIDQLGNKAAVLAPNWFAGTMTVHAIDKVLLPTKNFLPAAAPAAPAAAAAPAKKEEKKDDKKAEQKASGRRLLLVAPASR